MAKSSLTVPEVREMMLRVAQGMIDNEPMLTDADCAVGDGDHGTGIKRGFTAVKEKLEATEFESVSKVLGTTGMALISSMGGASGAVFGTFFRNGSKALAAEDVFDSAGLAQFLSAGLEGVMARGGARPGDKTMIDALDPAARRAGELAEAPLSEALAAALETADKGVEASRDMVATTGKARALGDRSLGHPDPGAISMSLILKFMSAYASS